MHSLNAVFPLFLFRVHSLRRTAQSEKYFRELPKHHQQLLPGFIEHLHSLQTCIEHNYEIVKLLIADTEHLFENRLDLFDTVSSISLFSLLYNIGTKLISVIKNCILSSRHRARNELNI